MQTLSSLQTRMNGNDPTDARAAANALTNYFLIYNDEYNALVQKQTEAEMAIVAESTNPAGVDHSVILHLQSLVLGIQSRTKVQDARMIAFRESTMAINPPTDAQVQEVRNLTMQVASVVAHDKAVQGLMLALGEIAGIVNQIQGG